MKKTYITLFVVLAMLAGSISNVMAAERSQLTNNFYDHQTASTANGHIAWWAYDGNDYEIYYWNGKTITQVTNNSVDDRYPSLSYSSKTVEIAWEQFDGSSDYEIWYWDGTTQTQITNSNNDDVHPSLHEGQIAWQSWDGSDFEIAFWDGNNVEFVTNNAVDDISVSNYGGNLAWSQWDNQDYEIIYKVGNSMTTVTNNNHDDYEPSLYNGAIAWYGWDGNDYEIYYWDGTPGENPLMVTNNTDDDLGAALFNNTIAWHGWDGNDYEIYYWWDGGTITKVTSNNTTDEFVSFRDGQLSYRGRDAFNNPQIYHTEAPEDPNLTCDIAITGFSIDTPSHPIAGEKVNLTATVKSACRGDIYYKFFYKGKYGTDGYEDAPWVTVQEYSTTNSAGFIFPEAGDYVLGFRAVLDPNDEPAALPLFGSVVTVE